ncbi:MAG: c-type cytochrome biogenesis protein CcsB [Armatimonadota bacterium]
MSAITMPLYFGAAALYLLTLLDDRRRAHRAASVLAAVGVGVQSIAIVCRGIEMHRVPFANLLESLPLIAWALMLLYLLIDHRQKAISLGLFASILAFSAVGAAWMYSSRSSPVAFHSRWNVIHVASCLIAYASFILAFGAALGYTLQAQFLRMKRVSVLHQYLPSLDVADQLAYRMVAIGFPMLTLGVITGAIWAQSAWGSYWSWDPKETWAFATWLVYAAYLHVRIVSGRRGKWPNRLLVAGLCCVIVTFAVVNYLPTGLHRYN